MGNLYNPFTTPPFHLPDSPSTNSPFARSLSGSDNRIPPVSLPGAEGMVYTSKVDQRSKRRRVTQSQTAGGS
jgi:hypothetical protein